MCVFRRMMVRDLPVLPSEHGCLSSQSVLWLCRSVQVGFLSETLHNLLGVLVYMGYWMSSVLPLCAYAKGFLCLCGKSVEGRYLLIMVKCLLRIMEASPITTRLQKLSGCCAAGINLLWHGWCAVEYLKWKILQIITFSFCTWDKRYLSTGTD